MASNCASTVLILIEQKLLPGAAMQLSLLERQTRNTVYVRSILSMTMAMFGCRQSRYPGSSRVLQTEVADSSQFRD